MTEALVPTLTGTSWISGLNTLVLDNDDPFTDGFTPGDIWA
nr:proline racemase family protein [Rhizobium sp. H4]